MNFATVTFFSFFAICVSATVRVKGEHPPDQSSETTDDKLIPVKPIGYMQSDPIAADIKEVDMDFAMQQDAIFTAARASSEIIDDELIPFNPIGNRRSDDVVAEIKEVDMNFAMQQDAIFTAARAKDMYSVEKDIAGYIKKTFDEKYGPTWQCIVGKDYGSFVTNEEKHFIFFYIGELAFLLFKSV